jgi:hypothetical protein
MVKSKPGSGFREWQRDFYLNDKITRTIVINLGAMKRSDVPDKAPRDLKSPPETISIKVSAPSDLKSPPETITIKEDKDGQEVEEDFVEYHNERENHG